MSTHHVSKQKTHGNWDLKIINAGFPRCGTSSLSAALEILGFGPTWHLETNNTFFSDKHYPFFKDKLYAIKRGEYVDFDAFFEKTQIRSAMDAPFIAIWKELSVFYPKAKIIVCVRDDYHKWQQSLSHATEWLITSKTLGAIAYYFTFISVMRNEFCRILYDEWVVALNTKSKYEARIEEIKQFINDDQRLLVLNVSSIKQQGWKPLCAFLNVPVPDIPYPRNNYSGRMMQRARTALIQLLTGFVLVPIVLAILVYYYYIL